MYSELPAYGQSRTKEAYAEERGPYLYVNMFREKSYKTRLQTMGKM